MSDNPYHGPRWMGLWNNPNDYGMLMGLGVVLAIGLLVPNLKFEKLKAEIKGRKAESGRRKTEMLWKFAIRNSQFITLLVAALMMGTGLVMSYSRGAWIGTTVGLLYLATAYGKFKWRWILPPVLIALVVICFFWNNTPDSASWYLKRMDLSRASVQHRVAAWKAGFEMMRDHPFGVGWNKAVEVYQKNYSPPGDGAAAITTNDYVMMQTRTMTTFPNWRPPKTCMAPGRKQPRGPCQRPRASHTHCSQWEPTRSHGRRTTRSGK
jgi:O-antigen ligase